MSLKIGIVGLPNVGKSTLFKALTKKEVLIENYPFATIDPSVGVVTVPDERVDKLSKMSQSDKSIYTVIEFVDIAGLVEGAHKGEGLGNQFLANIRECDAIAHVVRGFEDDDIHHVEGSINAGRDMETIHLELVMADLATVEKRIKSIEGKARSDKELAKTLDVYVKMKNALDEGKLANTVELTDDERVIIRDLHLLTIKPHMTVCNVKDGTVPINLNLSDKESVVCLDIKEELELSGLSREERNELGITETGLDRLIKESYKLLSLITFLTTGEKETRAWTTPEGSTAPQSAGVIHTDFEKGFIRAEVIQCQTLLDCGSWNVAKEKGLIRTEGKEYIIQDGDVVFFRTA